MAEHLCVDCKFCLCMAFSGYMCARPIGAAYSRVDGSPKRLLMVRCEQERRGHRTLTGRYKCGPEARYFTPINLGSPPAPSK